MLRCGEHGAEHDIRDPVCKRRESCVALGEAERVRPARDTDDTCVPRLPGAPERFFLRTVLAVEVAGQPVQLTRSTSRPESRFPAGLDQPCAAEYRAGISSHRASEWIALALSH